MKHFALLALLGLSLEADAAMFVSTNAGGFPGSTSYGLFSAGTSWIGGVAPSTDGDFWTINGAVTIIYDVDNSAHANGWGGNTTSTGCTNNGTLVMSNAYPCYMKMNGSLYGSNTASWFVGSAAAPITNSTTNTETCIVEFKAGSCAMPGTNTIQFYGTTNMWSDYLYNATASNANIGSTNLFFTNTVVGVASNDVIYLSNPAIRGQGGNTHIVYGVWSNCIVLNATAGTNQPIGLTNTWSGESFAGVVSVNNRTNAMVCKLTRPIVIYQRTKITSTSVFTAGKTNTFIGVRFTNCGQGPINNCNGSTITSCVGNNNSNGGIAYNCNGITITSCVGNNNTYGGIANTCNGSTITSCVGNNNANGGIAITCNVITITSCVGNNNANGGIANTCNGSTITSCVGNNNSNGGIAYNCNGITITSCVGNNNYNGGIANNCNGSTITSCVGNNNTFGGIAYTCNGSTITSCTNNTIPAYYRNGMLTIFGGNDLSISPSILSTYSFRPFDTTCINSTNFSSVGGTAFIEGTNSIQYYVTNVNNPIPAFVSVSPKRSISPTVWLWLTNNISFQVGYAATGAYPTALTTYSNSVAPGWTNFSVAIPNGLTLQATYPQTLWVICTSQNQNGLARITIPTEYQTSIMK